MDPKVLAQLVNAVVVSILCLTVHEYCHAWVARWLGDDTAERLGRLSLDPTRHIDIVGTLVLPVMGVLAGVPMLGWAKPVPTSPQRYTRRLFGRRVSPTTGMALVAAAGPLSNLSLALALALLLGGTMRVSELDQPLVALWWAAIAINMGLAVFNLIPLPPLDGSRIIVVFLSPARRQTFEEYAAMGSWMLFALIMLGGRFLSVIFAPFMALAQHTVAFAAGA